MARDRQFGNYRGGYLQQGAVMPMVSFSVLLSADGQAINPNKGQLCYLSSDNATATNRTFTLLDGQWSGQRFVINFISGSSYTCDLQSAGNVNLPSAWQPLQYETIELMWDKTAWCQIGRSLDNSLRVARYTVLYSDLNTAGDGVPYVAGPVVPDNAIIYQALVDVTTTFAGDGDDSSLISIGLEDQDNDIVAAVAIKTGTPWDAGIQACIPVGTAATAIKLTADRQLATTVDYATTDTTLSAGAMDVFIFYTVSST